MFSIEKNLCESVIEQNETKQYKWKDGLFIAPECQERFLVMSDVPEMKSHNIFMVGLAQLVKEYWVERTGPEFHSVLVTLEGGGTLHTDAGCFDISPSTMSFLPAGKPFRFELSPLYQHWKMVWLLLTDVEHWRDIHALSRPVFHFDSCESVWSLVSLTHKEIGGRATFRNLMLSELVKILSNVDKSLSDTHMRVLSVLNSVESQLQLNWTVSAIAARSYLSEEQLNRVVKKIVGMSTRDYLISLRMKKAVDLLDNKDWSVKMIALRLGYADPNNFTHRFKKFYGVSPRQYRSLKR